MINIDDFIKVELKVGTILEVEEVEGSEKLLKLKVDFGIIDVISNDNEKSQDLESRDPSKELESPQDFLLSQGDRRDIRQVLSGIKKWYSKEALEGTQAIFVANLEPRMMMGMESQAMIMATGDEEVVLLRPEKKVTAGAAIR